MKRKALTESTTLSKKLAKAVSQTRNKSSKTVDVHKSPFSQSQDAGAGDSPVRLGTGFYNQECISLAKGLLGKILVRERDGERLSGRVVETEAYLGVKDSACHSYKGHQSENNKGMWMAPGTVYVYLIYGMYNCMNISSRGDGCAVLLRALEPVDGESVMQELRSRRRTSTKELKKSALCSGPGKLTEALDITKNLFDKKTLLTDRTMWLEDGPPVSEEDIVSCPRIGIDYSSKEWKDKPLRFYIRGSKFISKRDKGAE